MCYIITIIEEGVCHLFKNNKRRLKNMRNFKKALAVVTTAVMTMAMGVSAFADTTVTYHFYNANNWDNVGAWVKQGVDWKEECLPLDKCVTNQVTGDDGLTYTKPLWPGAKMEAEGNGWYKVTCTYTDPSKGSMMIFNNYVGDSTPGDTTSAEDIQKLREAGVTLNDVAEKQQTPNIMIKKNEVTASEYWINWDGNTKGQMIQMGKSDMMTTTAPDNYKTSSAGTSTDNNSGAATTNNNGTAATNNNGTAATNNNSGSTGTGTNSGTKAPTTGDSVAVSVVLLGLASAVAVVAAKKKANA